MKTVKKLSGATLAVAAATLFVSGCATQQGTGFSATGLVECTGVNGCKGLSDCRTANNDCKGKNNCRGEGFRYMTPPDCWKNQLPQFKPH